MVKINGLISCCSPSFCQNEILVRELGSYFDDINWNINGYRFDRDELVEFIGDSVGVIVGLDIIDSDLLKQCSNLKIISKYGVGLDNIDLEACKSAGVRVGWRGGVNRQAVAEMALGLMIILLRNIHATSNQLKGMVWNKSGGNQLSEKTIGIIGLGNIGLELVRLLAPFRCTILINDIVDKTEFCLRHGLRQVSKAEIYKRADVITVHTPLDNSTRYMIGRVEFDQMERKPVLLNLARGSIIDEQQLLEALVDGRIAGAAIDVYESEPPANRQLLSHPNLIPTPHIGGNSYEAVLAMGRSAIDELVTGFQSLSKD